MAKHVISYDLMKGKDYTRLINELRRLGACRVLLSLWLWKSDDSTVTLRDHLAKFIDSDDRIIVIAATGDAAWLALTPAESQCAKGVLEG